MRAPTKIEPKHIVETLDRVILPKSMLDAPRQR